MARELKQLQMPDITLSNEVAPHLDLLPCDEGKYHLNSGEAERNGQSGLLLLMFLSTLSLT